VRFHVDEVEGSRIQRLTITFLPAPEEEAEAAAEG
jgi:hypothetical protein